MRTLLILFAAAMILFLPIIQAQNKPVKFNRLTSSDGLSQNRVFSILQDQDGFMWIGTEDGLNRYDGYKFEIFKRIPGDSLSLIDNASNVLYESKDGTLWIGGGQQGLSKYNSAAKEFTGYRNVHSDPNSIAGNFITSISEDEKGNLWLSTAENGLDYMIVNEGKFIHMKDMLPSQYQIKQDEIYFVYEDKQTNLWIGTADKIHYFKVNYSTGGIPELHPIEINNEVLNTAVTCIEEDEEGNIWIGTTGKGILLFDREQLSLRRYANIEQELLEYLIINDLESDGKGSLWIGGIPGQGKFRSGDNNSSSLIRLNVITGEVEKYLHDPKDAHSLSSNYVLSIYCDKTGVIWVGTVISGINIYDESVTKFSIYNSNPNETNRLKTPIRGFYQGEENILWIASQGDGLVSYDRNKDKQEFYRFNKNNNATMSSDFVSSIYDDGEYLWVGTFSGLNRFDKKTKRVKRIYIDSTDIDSDNNSINYNIIELDRFPGYLWFGTNGRGIIKFNKKDLTYKAYTYDPEDENSVNNRTNYVRTVWYSDNRPHELWAGTTNGINIFNFNTETFRYYNHEPNDSTSLSHPNVMNFYEDEKGYIWIATYGGGINRFDPKTEVFLRFTESSSGIPNNGTYGILPDKSGFLWISTNNGITKFNPVSFEFRNYTVDDGLQSEEFNGGSYFLSKNGEMFFGGINGYNSFFPDEVTDNKYKPKIVFTDLKLFNEPVKPGKDSPLKKQLSRTKEIVLEHWQNDVSFEYVALHFSNPSKNKYAFKLENYEDEWRYVDNVRNATYTNLDPGEYIFKVKGSNNDGLWNEEGISISLIIKPPWWRTMSAYISYGIIFAGLVFGVDRFQRRRLLAKARERMKMQEAEFRVQNAELQTRAMRAESERKSKELEEARELQLSMLPKELPALPHLDIAVYMRTATEVGGDYYDFNVSMDGTLTVVLGDATGHGMKAGTMVTAAKSLFNSYASNNDILFTFQEMTRCIKLLNFSNLSMCMTMLKISNNKLVFSSAGMPPVYLWREEMKSVEEFQFEAMPLGTMSGFPYEIRESELSPGDVILILSDGLPELKNADEQMFGYNKIVNIFNDMPHSEPEEIISQLKDEGLNWIGGGEPDDDLTFVVVKVK